MTTCYFLQIKIAITVHLIYNKSNFSFSSKKRHSQDLTSPLKFEIRLSPLLIFPKKIDREREREEQATIANLLPFSCRGFCSRFSYVSGPRRHLDPEFQVPQEHRCTEEKYLSTIPSTSFFPSPPPPPPPPSIRSEKRRGARRKSWIAGPDGYVEASGACNEFRSPGQKEERGGRAPLYCSR